MNTLLRRTVSTVLTTAVVGTALATGVASAAPGQVTAGPLSFPAAALPGWTISGPRATGTVGASVKLADTTWESVVELGTIDPTGRASEELARTIVRNAPHTPGYAKFNARVVGLTVTPTTVSGVSATRATATIEVQGAPVRGDRFHVIVVNTKPQTYFASAVPLDAADRIAQADAAEAGLTAKR